MRPTVKNQIETDQDLILAVYACRNKNGSERVHPEEADKFRTDFQRDRDRVLHSRSFRRLQGKTQVFRVGEGDHYRNRMTHSLEVQQIARDLGRSLKLNEDLIETIALCHDLGHPPFAHAGQDSLEHIMKTFGETFEHNQQSRRIVELLEHPYPQFSGLNLTKASLDGLLKHLPLFGHDKKVQKLNTLESQVVDIADEIAYYHHDLDDGFRSKILDMTHMLKNVYLIREAYDYLEHAYKMKLDGVFLRSRLLKRVVDRLVRDVWEASLQRIGQKKIKTFDDLQKISDPLIGFSAEMAPQVKTLRRYLYDNFYFSSYIKQQAKEADTVITTLFEYFQKHPRTLPDEEQARIKQGDTVPIVIKDYIAGMTDRFALTIYQEVNPKRKLSATQLSLLEKQE